MAMFLQWNMWLTGCRENYEHTFILHAHCYQPAKKTILK